jgi:cytochrome c-type biogenesis protein CcmE
MINLLSTPIKGEGMVANPDDFEFACVCAKCQEKYRNWKAQYQEQQSAMRERSEMRKNLEARQQED